MYLQYNLTIHSYNVGVDECKFIILFCFIRKIFLNKSNVSMTMNKIVYSVVNEALNYCVGLLLMLLFSRFYDMGYLNDMENFRAWCLV